MWTDSDVHKVGIQKTIENRAPSDKNIVLGAVTLFMGGEVTSKKSSSGE